MDSSREFLTPRAMRVLNRPRSRNGDYQRDHYVARAVYCWLKGSGGPPTQILLLEPSCSSSSFPGGLMNIDCVVVMRSATRGGWLWLDDRRYSSSLPRTGPNGSILGFDQGPRYSSFDPSGVGGKRSART